MWQAIMLVFGRVNLVLASLPTATMITKQVWGDVVNRLGQLVNFAAF